jgi:ethanolamine-phosphate cytidylyltransferase
VVYVDGDWDLFNAAHIHTLRCCQQLGNYLVVGVHSDVVVVRRREIREIGMEPVPFA